MVNKISKKFIRGMGSVMDIYPRKSYPVRTYPSGKSAAQRLREDWERVGQSISIHAHAKAE